MTNAPRYIPALDGLRAASILLVMLSHLGLRELVPGGFGVTIFFFISGLLITRQLLDEVGRSGTIRLQAFFMRRILRLYPALLVMVAIGGAVFATLGGRVTSGQVLASLLYTSNWLLLDNGFPSGLPDDYHPYSILWSLAIEEQFYILLPIVVLVAGTWRRFDAVLLGLIAGIIAWRLHVSAACHAHAALCLGMNAADRINYGTDTRLDGFLYGSLLAARPFKRPRAGMLVLAGLLLLAGFLIRTEFFRLNGTLLVQGIGLNFGVGWLLAGPADRWPVRILTWRPSVLVGRWSYSLYLWHWVVMVCAAAWLPGGLAALTGEGRADFTWPVFLPPLMAASFALACASYYLVERPMLRWRRRFGSVTEPDVPDGRASGAFPSSRKVPAAIRK